MLYSGCNFVIVPREEPSHLRLTLTFDHQSDTEVEQIMTAVTVKSDNTTFTDATIVKNNDSEHPSVNISLSYCNISSLEVYRGRKQAIEISHDGFSLSDRGAIQVRLLIRIQLFLDLDCTMVLV